MKKLNTLRGWTMLELMVSTGAIVIGGVTFFWVLSTITELAARNNAINQSHQDARKMLLHAVNEIHSSISVMTSVDTTLTPVTPQSTAANGIIYQIQTCGPGKIAANSTAGSNTVVVTFSNPWDPDGSPDVAPAPAAPPTAPVPQVGNRLIIPALSSGGYGEYTITAVSGTWASYPSTPSATFTLTLSQPIPVSIDVTTPNPNTNVPSNYQVYCSARAALVANGTDLRYYPNVANSTTYYTLVKNLVQTTPGVTPTPFQIRDGTGQQIQVSLATSEPRATARGYQFINFETTVTVPIRSLTAHKVP